MGLYSPRQWARGRRRAGGAKCSLRQGIASCLWDCPWHHEASSWRPIARSRRLQRNLGRSSWK
eukprot:2628658-Pyramimonas_sp.AAC.1